MSEHLVKAAADAMKAKRDELIAQPLARIWDDLAKAAMFAIMMAQSEAAKSPCTHPNRQGTGHVSSNGSSSWDWWCPSCGQSSAGHVELKMGR